MVVFFGNPGEEQDLTKYRHKLLNTSVTFGTPVTCEYDLSCYTLNAASIYGPAMIQIENLINNVVNPSLILKQNILASVPGTGERLLEANYIKSLVYLHCKLRLI